MQRLATQWTSTDRSAATVAVPRFAPSITACAIGAVMMPRAANEPVMTAVAVLDCRPSVASRPQSAATTRLLVAREIHCRNVAPKARMTPVRISRRPQSSSAAAARRSMN